MKKSILAIGLSVSLITVSGVASAQNTGVPVINADGNSGTSNAGLNPAVDANGPTIVYGDINPGTGDTVIGAPIKDMVPVNVPGTTGDISAIDGDAAALGPGSASAAPGTVTHDGSSGTSLLGPDGTYSVTEVSPSDVTLGDSGAAAPVYEPAPVVASDVAVEAPTDSTSTVADSDGDGVADADEVNIYGTDPYVWDTDGDGIADGEELFGVGSDPLVWDGETGTVSDTGVETVAATELIAAEGVGPEGAAVDSDSDRLADADELAIGTDPNTPDSDGDGYYDGDEANLGTDPFDPASFPTEAEPTSSV